jgi:hypothetical protein
MAKVINQGSGVASVIAQSIQGDASVGSGPLFVDTAIATVDVNNTVVEWVAIDGTSDDGKNTVGMGEITSSTNLRISRGNGLGVAGWNFRVIEFSNLKSLNKGTVSLTAGVALDTAIPAVDIDKCQIYVSFQHVGYSDPTPIDETNVFRRLTTTTNFQLLSRTSDCEVSYFIAEQF